ncbi:MAG: lytic transglycosylase domain-containing protein, partial [Alphaproteobacteria bacterium]|nr:lytic transglycosylase domain-containing protein [Alphaproteobacteria bacterium]
MRNIPARKQFVRRLPKLATMAFVFWGLSSGASIDAAPASMIQGLPPRVAPEEKSSLGNAIHVLSPRDATLYRAAFAAQQKANWGFADEALGQVNDKRLAGHILADRFLRRGMTLDEAKSWFASYASLPEAGDLYSIAKRLRGFSGAGIKKPSGTEWTGINGVDSPTVFRSSNDNSRSSTAARKVNTASPLVNRNDVAALPSGNFSSRMAASFFYGGNIGNARKAAHTGAQAGIPLSLWIEGLSTWKERDFGTSASSFAKLARSEGLTAWNKAAASYWAYRANSRLGDKGQAYRWLAEAANYPQTFYGALAAQLMGRQAERSWRLPELNAKAIERLSGHTHGWQALALAQVGRVDLAESALRQLLSNGNVQKLQPAALALAEKANMPSLVLALSGVVANDGKPFDAALYPLPPWQPAGGFKVDRALIYAIMRHESQFDPEAISVRGACGLMQIMPATARHIDKLPVKRAANANCAHRLFDPETNVEMGQRYVQALSGTPMIGNNLVYLLAAYNGGPGNLARWMGSADKSDPLLFIESLPVRETRDYVQQILLHFSMYKARLSQPEIGR